MKTQTVSIVAAVTILLVGCRKQNGSSGTTTSPANEPSSAESATTAAKLTGTWKVALSKSNTTPQNAEYTLKLAMAGGRLAGTISHVSTVNGKSRVYTSPIKDAKLQGGEFSFSVTQPFEVGHGEVTTSYRGNISDDTIKGTYKASFLGHPVAGYWTGEREGGAHE